MMPKGISRPYKQNAQLGKIGYYIYHVILVDAILNSK